MQLDVHFGVAWISLVWARSHGRYERFKLAMSIVHFVAVAREVPIPLDQTCKLDRLSPNMPLTVTSSDFLVAQIETHCMDAVP
jgi:hypothetical protein